MSWESINSKDLLRYFSAFCLLKLLFNGYKFISIYIHSIPPSQNLSATRLLTSPDGSRYLLENSSGLNVTSLKVFNNVV